MKSLLHHLPDGSVRLEVNIGNEVFYSQYEAPKVAHILATEAPVGWHDDYIKKCLIREIVNMLETKIRKDLYYGL